MRSALAAVVAVALIGGALYLRTTVIAPADPVTPDGDGTTVVEGAADVLVMCDALLADACPAGSTVTGLSGILAAMQATTGRPDVLVAPARVVELVEQSRTSRATFATDRTVLGLTPLVVAVAVSRDETVADACPASVTWSCLADLIRAGSLAPAISDPVATTAGIASFAALTGGFLGTDTYSSNALGGAGFFGWLDAMQADVATVSDPLNDLILFGGARNDSAVVLEAEALDTMGRAAANIPDLYWPTPLASLAIVAVGIDGADEGSVRQVASGVAVSLADAGWRGADGAPTEPEAPMVDPAADGLPGGGVLFALRDRW